MDYKKLPNCDIPKNFPRDCAAPYDRLAILWSLTFYGLYVAAARTWISWYLFALLGYIAVMRVFNAHHLTFHANTHKSSSYQYFRWIIIVIAPWQLGYRDFKKNHLSHHTHVNTERDPEYYLQTGPPLRGLWNALTEPEQSVIRQIYRYGCDFVLVRNLMLYAMIYMLMMYIGGWPGFIAYNLTARLGNTSAWWVANYWLHQPRWYKESMKLPKWIARPYIYTFGRDAFNGAQFHSMHHDYQWVPDRMLPDLARYVESLQLIAVK